MRLQFDDVLLSKFLTVGLQNEGLIKSNEFVRSTELHADEGSYEAYLTVYKVLLH